MSGDGSLEYALALDLRRELGGAAAEDGGVVWPTSYLRLARWVFANFVLRSTVRELERKAAAWDELQAQARPGIETVLTSESRLRELEAHVSEIRSQLGPLMGELLPTVRRAESDWAKLATFSERLSAVAKDQTMADHWLEDTQKAFAAIGAWLLSTDPCSAEGQRELGTMLEDLFGPPDPEELELAEGEDDADAEG